MGFIIFLFLFGAVVFFLWIVLAILSLFLGGECPNKKWLEEEHRHWDLCDAIERSGKEHHTHYTDARQVHYHGLSEHKYLK